ncbi:hypothetical protein K432DRAFT_395722 [Lepidopterella palustris CBS 459.81]|uniref:Uncharacterized protein n=1 Tax=Lepidopterella palustris CBS 459.81 TaxID=1314670 RepID=A0A8E2JC91_9PEZI|nr:hypothetical protein K432DRAFT_395722 [Lepidopterella palustris CBS 459.81]
MEPARDAPWAEHEYVDLLAEIIKAAPVPSNVLFGIIREAQIQPKWNDIALPRGRSVKSCQQAFLDLSSGYAASDYRHRPQLPAPTFYSGPEISKKRPHQPEASTPTGRLLQPRPPHSYSGEFVSGPAYAISPVGEPANKKKRGRPTKAEAQARADAAAARGEPYPPPRRQRTSLPSAETPQPLPGSITPGPPPGSTTPGLAPVAPMAATTPQISQAEAGSESSSSKKKRGKPTRLELERHQAEEGATETESPSFIGSAPAEGSRPPIFSQFTPVSAAPLSATEHRDRDTRMEGMEESQPRTTTPRSFKDTVGI